MAVYRLAWLVCDRCELHCPEGHETETVRQSRELAKEHGWRMRKGEDICPDCIEDLAEDTEGSGTHVSEGGRCLGS